MQLDHSGKYMSNNQECRKTENIEKEVDPKKNSSTNNTGRKLRSLMNHEIEKLMDREDIRYVKAQRLMGFGAYTNETT